jgi:IS5 family transposase
MDRNEYTYGDYEAIERLKKLQPSSILFRINDLVDWEPIHKLVSPLDSRNKNKSGRDGYDPFKMFKIHLIQDLKGYSDPQMEERLITDISYMWFCGFSLRSEVPDHSTISRWRNHFNKANIFQSAFQEFNDQLAFKGFSYKRGVVVDATMIQSSTRNRYQTVVYEQDKDSEELVKKTLDVRKHKGSVELKANADPDAVFVKIGGKSTFGFKMHTASDMEGLILGINTTAANVLEGHQFPKLMSSLLFDSDDIYGDKGFSYASCVAYLKENGLGDKLMRKKPKGKDMDIITTAFNKSISSVRYVIERTFGGLKKWLKLGRARYIGLFKTHNHNLRLASIYNLVRCAGAS